MHLLILGSPVANILPPPEGEQVWTHFKRNHHSAYPAYFYLEEDGKNLKRNPHNSEGTSMD